MIGLLVITDGRGPCLKRTLMALEQKLVGGFSYRLMVDDSMQPDYAAWLDATYPMFDHLHLEPKAGFCGAIQAGWERLGWENVDYILHVEDDFELVEQINLADLQQALDENPHLVQMALKRQPVNDMEKKAGDLVRMWPQEFTDTEKWLEHRLWFTTNVSLYRASLMIKGWPDPPQCERHFTDRLLTEGFDHVAPDDVRFGLWGRRDDPPKIWHIGDQRVGTGY